MILVYVTDRNVFPLLSNTSVLAVQKHEDTATVEFILADETAKGNVRQCIEDTYMFRHVFNQFKNIRLPQNDLSPFYLTDNDDVLIPYYSEGKVCMSQVKVVTTKEHYDE